MADSTYSGMSTSDNRVNIGKDTSKPKPSKVISNDAKGASMDCRGSPDGWATYGHGSSGTKKPMQSESYPKGSSTKKANMTPRSATTEKL